MIVTVNTSSMESSQNDRQIFGSAIISEIRLLLSLEKISDMGLSKLIRWQMSGVITMISSVVRKIFRERDFFVTYDHSDYS